MNALRQLGARVSEQLAGGSRPVDCSGLSDAQLYARCPFDKFEDLHPMEQKAILDVRAEVIADPQAWAQAYLEEPDCIDKELRYAMFMFLHRGARPTDDLEALAACDLAAGQLREVGILPWYEIIVRGPEIPGQPRVTVSLPDNGRGDLGRL